MCSTSLLDPSLLGTTFDSESTEKMRREAFELPQNFKIKHKYFHSLIKVTTQKTDIKQLIIPKKPILSH